MYNFDPFIVYVRDKYHPKLFIGVDALSRNCALRLCKGLEGPGTYILTMLVYTSLEGQTNRYT